MCFIPTELGRKVYFDYWDGKLSLPDKVCHMQMHSFMLVFGEHCFVGNDNLIENNEFWFEGAK